MSSTALLTHAQALFYILALNVFHIYYALHTATRRTYLALREWYVGPLASCTAPTPDTVRADTERLSKIPRHLAVLVMNEEGGASRCDEELVQDVVKLACYCSAAGIVELTVYEATEQDLTEPNLMIVIGGTPHKYVSLEGFPPWHVRLTEIVNMSGHDRIDYTLFLRSLYRYSKVEQRFGR
ncbi:hypothetical protein BC938DRAFT_472378 [Jimgerdemannia flammicorona]|uniref:ditrans,polycis-polyprenyl diphosphate synthase [(2E,6E)-farnesyldiphosphate specific] n=1 Tax=Jimgerdemannia flammicorona TaxID=994334 RepID=A0A433QTY3_9FUNG|nr:hypothetical protein BC938DRAFT_472378 [Jimgerdemannia flammicorona]